MGRMNPERRKQEVSRLVASLNAEAKKNPPNRELMLKAFHVLKDLVGERAAGDALSPQARTAIETAVRLRSLKRTDGVRLAKRAKPNRNPPTRYRF